MGAINPPVVTFTGGVVGQILHNRVDIQTYPTAAEEQTNCWPTAQGPLHRRPPLKFVEEFVNSDRKGKLFPFVFSVDQSYIILATESGFEFFTQDGKIVIDTVSSAFSTFTSGWFDTSSGASSATIVGDLLYLDSDGGTEASGEKVLTVSNINSMHIIKLSVFHGPVNVRIGSSSGGTQYYDERDFGTGVHYIEVTPTSGSLYFTVWHEDNTARIIEGLSVVSGTNRLLVEHPYLEEDLPYVHYQQIGDVLYLTNSRYWTRRLMRRGHRTWSVERFLPPDGPFAKQDDQGIQIRPSATSGWINLYSSAPYFDLENDEDCLFEITNSGQSSELTTSVSDVQTSGIKVTGVADAQRTFQVEITGTFVGTVWLQRSSGNENSYTDFRSYTAPIVEAIDDNLDNQTWYYRLRIKPGGLTSGTVTIRIFFAGGTTTGICRVVSVTTSQAAIAEVLQPFSNTAFSSTWRRGEWSGRDGFPVSVTRGFGRLWLARGIKLWGSKSDDFTSFEDGAEADNSISFSIAAPSSDAVRYLAFLSHLVVGTATAEFIGLGNTQSEPVGPSNFQIIPSSEEGGAKIMPVTVSGSVLYAHRNLNKLMQFTQNPKALSDTSYISVDLNRLSPELLKPGILSLGIQSEPERRNHLVLSDGTLWSLLFRREEDIVAWSKIVTDGRFEDVQVISQNDQDAVYAIVRRKIGGSWVRYIERFGVEDPANDEDMFHLDSYLSYDLIRPDAIAEPSGTTGTVTVNADGAAFLVGDVGMTMWINGGRGVITSYTNNASVQVQIYSELESTNPSAPGMWGMNDEVSTVSGLDHLEGKTVRIYGDRMDLGTATVASGSITLPKACSVVHVGLPFESRYKSLKLSYGAQKGTALNMPKAVKNIGFLLYKCGPSGMYFGHSFDKMNPLVLKSAQTPLGEPDPLFTGEKYEAFNARYNEDARICIKWTGCAPGTIAGLVPAIDEHDR
jgi:hypothetical protein